MRCSAFTFGSGYAVGVVERSEQWKSRYHHLSHSGHNWLRITRILKSLGELGVCTFVFRSGYFDVL